MNYPQKSFHISFLFVVCLFFVLEKNEKKKKKVRERHFFPLLHQRVTQELHIQYIGSKLLYIKILPIWHLSRTADGIRHQSGWVSINLIDKNFG